MNIFLFYHQFCSFLETNKAYTLIWIVNLQSHLNFEVIYLIILSVFKRALFHNIYKISDILHESADMVKSG